MERKVKYRDAVLICNYNRTSNFQNVTILQNVEIYNDTVRKYGYAVKQPSSSANKQNTTLPVFDSESCEMADFTKWNSLSYILVDERIEGILDDLKYFASLQNGYGDNKKTPDIKKVIKSSQATDPPKSSNDKIHWMKFWTYPFFKIWKIFDFSKMPIELLTIIVVMAMGALGGSIRLTRKYLEHDKKNVNLAIYCFYPLLGSVTAFAVYILAKAGVLIISDSGSGGRGGALSPYFISFIGLVSGLLADNALNTIRRVGTGWFKDADGGRPRYWIGAIEVDESDQQQDAVEGDGGEVDIVETSQEAAKNKLKDDIATLLNVNDKTVEKWLQGNKLVPPDAQEMIAAWLHTPQRDLFSDMPPKEMLARKKTEQPA